MAEREREKGRVMERKTKTDRKKEREKPLAGKIRMIWK